MLPFFTNPFDIQFRKRVEINILKCKTYRISKQARRFFFSSYKHVAASLYSHEPDRLVTVKAIIILQFGSNDSS